ncbi:MAG TPA: hypothetical protein VFE06_02125 [Acidobacteriaceae bacterium]|jgi:hypothetical protein|nr:hypothetical protein [Acidobacteriaceae bacterium]
MSGFLKSRLCCIAAALALVVCLAALLVHPAASPAGAVLAVFLLLPVALFGFVLLPLSLGSVVKWEPRLAVPVLIRGQLFQRPPPVSLQ